MFLPEDFDLHQWELTCHSLADNVLWRQVMEGNLRESARFEIHCWTEETEELRAALRFGAPADAAQKDPDRAQNKKEDRPPQEDSPIVSVLEEYLKNSAGR